MIGGSDSGSPNRKADMTTRKAERLTGYEIRRLPDGASGRIAYGAFLGDENDFALAMNLMIPFAFFMFMGARNKLKKLRSR